MSVTAPDTVPTPARPALPPGLPACAVVDLDAVSANVAALRRIAAGARLMAVVKADGYGHGMVPVARAALAGGADQLGVAHLREALDLRAAGIDAPVLAWLTVPGDRYADAVAADVEIGVSAPSTLEEVAAAARAVGRVARVQLKADTGLSRNGCPPELWPELVAATGRLAAEGAVELDRSLLPPRLRRRAGAPQRARPARGVRGGGRRRRAGRAAGAAAAPGELRGDGARRARPVRPGAARDLGLRVLAGAGRVSAAELGLRPAMTLLARVAMVKRVPQGAGVSYGHTYRTPRRPRSPSSPSATATACRGTPAAPGPCCSAAGATLSPGGSAWTRSSSTSDPTGTPAIGDVAVVFGDGRDGGPTATDWADAAGTIDYEIVTRIGGRVPRLYVGSAAAPAGTTGGGAS